MCSLANSRLCRIQLQVVSPLAIAGSIMQSGIVFQPAILCFMLLAILMGGITLGIRPTVTWLSQKQNGHQRSQESSNGLIAQFHVLRERNSSIELPQLPSPIRHRRRYADPDQDHV